jgi:hypothetical protein
MKKQSPEGEELITVQDAAKLANVTETAIRSALLRGRLPHVVLYGRKLIRVADFEAYRATARPGRPTKQPTA